MQTPLQPTIRYLTPRWAVLMNVFGTIAMIRAFVGLYRDQGWSWLTIAIAASIPLFFAGIADSLLSNVEIRDGRLIVVRDFKRNEYPADAFSKVTWSKGAPVSLQLSMGRWLHLPAVGADNRSLANSIRAWLDAHALSH